MANKNIAIPVPVRDYAAALDIPEHIADGMYIAFHNKKSVEPFVFALARNRRINESKARDLKTKFVKFCKNFKHSTEGYSYDIKPTRNGVDEALKVFESMVGNFPTVTANPAVVGRKKVIIASDFHYPFINEKAVSALLNDEADVLIMAGDTLDLYAASRHSKNLDGISVTDELRGGTALLTSLAKKFNRVYYIEGNHDKRAEKFLQNNFPQIIPLLSSPMELMSRKLENVSALTVSTLGTAPALPYSQDYALDTLGTLGDFVISHLESFSGKDAPEQAYKWIDSFRNFLDLPPVVSALFQAHTHRMGSQVLNDGRLLIATGCMCQPMPYIFDNSGKYPVPVPGYVTFYTDNDFNIDLSSIKLNHVGF